MGENTKIEWCDHTFNPWVGCTPVSTACDFCYAEAWAKRTGQAQLWKGERRRTTDAYWLQPLRWAAKAKAAGVRRRVFCASLADVFDNQVPAEWRRDLMTLIWETRDDLIWLLLTKRPQNIMGMIEEALAPPFGSMEHWPWPNVWLGTTVENQEEAARRIPHLLETPAAVRFLSCEPLLGPINLRDVANNGDGYYDVLELCPAEQALAGVAIPAVDWVIAGGESGPKARPMHPAWALDLRDQCAAAGVPFFFKQWGEWIGADEWFSVLERDGFQFRAPGDRSPTRPLNFADAAGLAGIAGDAFEHQSDGTTLIRIGKKRAGRLLDGREHNDYPDSAHAHGHLERSEA